MRRSFDDKAGLVSSSVDFWKDTNNQATQKNFLNEKPAFHRISHKFTEYSKDDSHIPTMSELLGTTTFHHVGNVEKGRQVLGKLSQESRSINDNNKTQLVSNLPKTYSPTKPDHRKKHESSVISGHKPYSNMDSQSMSGVMGTKASPNPTQGRSANILSQQSKAVNTSVAETFGSPNRAKVGRSFSANKIRREMINENTTVAGIFGLTTSPATKTEELQRKKTHNLIGEFNKVNIASALKGEVVSSTHDGRDGVAGRFNRTSTLANEFNKVTIEEALTGDVGSPTKSSRSTTPTMLPRSNRSHTLLKEYNKVSVADALGNCDMDGSKSPSSKEDKSTSASASASASVTSLDTSSTAAKRHVKTQMLTKKKPFVFGSGNTSKQLNAAAAESRPTYGRIRAIEHDYNRVSISQALDNKGLNKSDDGDVRSTSRGSRTKSPTTLRHSKNHLITRPEVVDVYAPVDVETNISVVLSPTNKRAPKFAHVSPKNQRNEQSGNKNGTMIVKSSNNNNKNNNTTNANKASKIEAADASYKKLHTLMSEFNRSTVADSLNSTAGLVERTSARSPARSPRVKSPKKRLADTAGSSGLKIVVAVE